VAVSGGLTFAAVSAGNEHTCGVTIAGAAYCWGENGYGGLLGNGDTTSSSTPVAVSGGLTFAAVSLGMYHTCGVTTASAAYCWGFNSYGELGNGSTANSRTPARVGP
jgi:alpha-tubulin suppressor-like RCC1 family protein